MELKDKLEILIKRNGYKKTDFASAVSITYRALANYISGARTPRAKTLSDMAVPVSYTHLDVYKRQAEYTCSLFVFKFHLLLSFRCQLLYSAFIFTYS